MRTPLHVIHHGMRVTSVSAERKSSSLHYSQLDARRYKIYDFTVYCSLQLSIDDLILHVLILFLACSHLVITLCSNGIGLYIFD